MEVSLTVARKHVPSLAPLARHDDIITDALLDKVYFWAHIRKNRSSHLPSRGVNEEEMASILREWVIEKKNSSEATKRILNMKGLSRYEQSLKSEADKEQFRRHLHKYVRLYMPDCPWEVSTTNRYLVTEHDACVIARRDIQKGEMIKYLSGIQVPMTEEEVEQLDVTRRDFSIVMSSRKKVPSLFLGPARFANHDCKANARLSTTGSNGMQIVATRKIEVGEEITVTYGADYFGEDNCECLCASCEMHGKGGWDPTNNRESIEEPASDGADTEEELQPYSFRRKRRYAVDKDTETTSELAFSITRSEKRTFDRVDELSVPAACVEPPAKMRRTSSVNVTPQPEAHLSTEGANSSMTHMQDVKVLEPLLRPYSGLQVTRDSSLSTLGRRSNSCRSSSADSLGCSTDATSLPDSRTNTPRKDRDLSTIEDRSSSPYSHELVAHVPILAVQDDALSDSELSTLSESYSLDDNKAEVIRHRHTRSRARSHVKTAFVPGSAPQNTDDASTRFPGDYVRTPRLLTTVYHRWVECQNCDDQFVQEDAYLIRANCPRCERHSKLYGYVWPKTEKEGKDDKEERVLDHRTVQRFVISEKEACSAKEQTDGEGAGKKKARRGSKKPKSPIRAKTKKTRGRVLDSKSRGRKRGPGRPASSSKRSRR